MIREFTKSNHIVVAIRAGPLARRARSSFHVLAPDLRGHGDSEHDPEYRYHHAGVAKDIKTPGPYAGIPLMPLKEHLKSQASIRRLASVRDTIKRLEKRIAALESGSPD